MELAESEVVPLLLYSSPSFQLSGTQLCSWNSVSTLDQEEILRKPGTKITREKEEICVADDNELPFGTGLHTFNFFFLNI